MTGTCSLNADTSSVCTSQASTSHSTAQSIPQALNQHPSYQERHDSILKELGLDEDSGDDANLTARKPKLALLEMLNDSEGLEAAEMIRPRRDEFQRSAGIGDGGIFRPTSTNASPDLSTEIERKMRLNHINVNGVFAVERESSEESDQTDNLGIRSQHLNTRNHGGGVPLPM